jgi:hypothetical protein
MKSAAGRVLQDDKDFLVELIDWQGMPAVKKSAKPTTPPERCARLKNEAYGISFLSQLAAKHPETNLYIPRLFEAGETHLIREYIEAEPVSSSNRTFQETAGRLDKLASQLAQIDCIEPYGETRFVGHFDYRDIRKNFGKWTADTLADGQITQSQLDRLNQILEPKLTYLSPRITHGDLSPHAHAYIMDDGKIAWVDLENFTPSGARYYDVARVYVRLYSYEAATETPKHFLTSFLNHADRVEHMEEQLMAIFLQRTLGMQYDAWYDARKGDDYRERAKELFELVLKNKLELLHD